MSHQEFIDEFVIRFIFPWTSSVFTPQLKEILYIKPQCSNFGIITAFLLWSVQIQSLLVEVGEAGVIKFTKFIYLAWNKCIVKVRTIPYKAEEFGYHCYEMD